MWILDSNKRYLTTLAIAFALAALPAVALAQGPGPRSAMEAVQLDSWFEVQSRTSSFGEALGALTRPGFDRTGKLEEGFLPRLPFDVDQLTEPATNIGSGGTLQAWFELSCLDSDDLDVAADLKGRVVFQVWVEDSATGKMYRLTKLRARTNGSGYLFDEKGAKLVKLRKGDNLRFQILRESLAPLRDAYCFFGFGIYREFTGE